MDCKDDYIEIAVFTMFLILHCFLRYAFFEFLFNIKLALLIILYMIFLYISVTVIKELIKFYYTRHVKYDHLVF